jgi:hypothetical protein
MEGSSPFFPSGIINCSMTAACHALEHEPALLQRSAENNPLVFMLSCNTRMPILVYVATVAICRLFFVPFLSLFRFAFSAFSVHNVLRCWFQHDSKD